MRAVRLCFGKFYESMGMNIGAIIGWCGAKYTQNGTKQSKTHIKNRLKRTFPF